LTQEEKNYVQSICENKHPDAFTVRGFVYVPGCSQPRQHHETGGGQQRAADLLLGLRKRQPAAALSAWLFAEL
jgi:hypothetical protein